MIDWRALFAVILIPIAVIGVITIVDWIEDFWKEMNGNG